MFWKREKTAVIKPDELAAEIAGGRAPVIVDVRSENDFRTGHLPGAINIPLDELERRKAELDSAKPMVFY
jgi:rhodanese-related sulfurtransferase